MQFFNKQHYWKILLATSLSFFVVIAGQGVLIIIAIALFTYYFSLNINVTFPFRWWMVALIFTPLIIKKVFITEYHFEDFGNNIYTTHKLMSIVGLSYITFNAIGYLIDIKRKYIEPQSNFFKLLFFLIYFPIIFSGPLTRAKHFFSQIDNISLKNDSIVNGLRLILWGLFKNLVIGGRILQLMNMLKELNLKGPYYLINGFVFFLFLYCTFSSFINVFQGISLIFNIQVNDNFKNRIYLSASRGEFWKGWHITLNHWFRDYFFYEIIRFDKKSKYTNLLLFATFICIALWHDFTWVFLTWGILNATWLIAERKLKKYIHVKEKLSFIGIIYHLCIASFLATIFISNDITTLFETLLDFSKHTYNFKKLLTSNTFILIFSFLFMDYFESKTKEIRIDKYIAIQSVGSRYFFYYLLCLFILVFALDPKIANYYNLF
jgi:alginate O-acetyltransferase complex protein AlgI